MIISHKRIYLIFNVKISIEIHILTVVLIIKVSLSFIHTSSLLFTSGLSEISVAPPLVRPVIFKTESKITYRRENLCQQLNPMESITIPTKNQNQNINKIFMKTCE